MKASAAGRRRRGGNGSAACKAFTLVELLVVIAISVILLGLLFGPIIQSFNLTRKARSVAQAQDAARFGMERLTRELSEAAYVFDNTTTPVILPLEDVANARRLNAYGAGAGLAYPGGDATPPIIGAKIDLLVAATYGSRRGDPLAPGDMRDPTTGGLVGGSNPRFPLAPGSRAVRYFIGLRNPVVKDNAGQIVYAGGLPQLRFYSNVYEFPRSDDDLNPFILYRAEFDPSDPNLINQNPTDYDSVQENRGGFNDPNFFYNLNPASSQSRQIGPGGENPWVGNGKSYAENWQAIATPMMSSQNADLLAWRKDRARAYVTGDPFQVLASFSPSTVVGDTATPGFLESAGSEAPSAVPTNYRAKYAQWVLPYALTVYRGATRNSLSGPNAGTLSLVVEQAPTATPGVFQQQVSLRNSTGVLATTGDNLYYSVNPASGRLFVKTPNLAFAVDPNRGRIETGLPPLAGSNTGVPFFTDSTGTIYTMQPASAGPNFGEPLQTVFRLNTRSVSAGGTDALGNKIPTNQGILAADLFRNQTTAGGMGANYYAAPAPGVSGVGLLAPDSAPYVSPYTVFAQAATHAGIMLAHGSERVTGPDNALTYTNLVPYTRVPAVVTTDASQPGQVVPDTNDPTKDMYAAFVDGTRDYGIETDLPPYDRAVLKFDLPGMPGQKIVGLPAKRSTDTSATTPQKEIRVFYLWQNNYTRNANGEPVDANGNAVAAEGRTTIRREADVVKVDYSTRSLINIALGARVYDASSGQPQLIQVRDKVQINNASR